jgi:hypothetical protein
MQFQLQYALKWIDQWMVPIGIATLEQLLIHPQSPTSLLQILKKLREE